MICPALQIWGDEGFYSLLIAGGGDDGQSWALASRAALAQARAHPIRPSRPRLPSVVFLMVSARAKLARATSITLLPQLALNAVNVLTGCPTPLQSLITMSAPAGVIASSIVLPVPRFLAMSWEAEVNQSIPQLRLSQNLYQFRIIEKRQNLFGAHFGGAICPHVCHSSHG